MVRAALTCTVARFAEVIPEPSSPLWSTVKAVYDPWPQDLEEVARQLGDGWRGRQRAPLAEVGNQCVATCA
ncbi:MAG: hypothetical protein GEV28_10260 [Actinophytocola sp.]|uniref:WXG100-like domain-containing protein n=1 Tax=Actinophytocola sp. TaxID=1872138 RepID=UPI00132ADB6A|nr:hypothetical protein [Actinophytocola sp.]MPZ80748.1 hypothetical protein [Actinophytocola sp.]